jgi:Domain of unknown function (DUF4397)
LLKHLPKIICISLFIACSFAQEDSATLEVQQDQTATPVVNEQQQSIQIAAVRVANMLPGVPMVDLSVDGRLRIQDVVYGSVSGYILVPIDKVKLALMPHVPINEKGEVLDGNQPPELIPFVAPLQPDRYYTLVFSYSDTSEIGQQVFNSSLVSIFENTFETPLPGQARIRLNNTSTESINLSVKERKNPQEEFAVLQTLEIPLLSTEVLNIPSGAYTFSFANGEADLEVALQAGTFYTFYLFRDDGQWVINPDVDGVLGTLIEGSQ